ncbi:hypothetical protein [Dactylosporangium sp. NPDC051541]|uniref:hypothetical protein n=1 Tax=Dactylosporangium sp. NPDC051541 TaxID=3363977 RepID=UPI00379C3D70
MVVRAMACTLTTAAGMFDPWQPDAFRFAPININADGPFRVVAQIGHDQGDLLDDRDHRHRAATSQPPYLPQSQGTVHLGGKEAIGMFTGTPAAEIALEHGRYAVTVHVHFRTCSSS